jgi:hypothetical protein
MPHWTDAFSFTTGAIRNAERLYLLATEDKLAKKQIPHASVITWHNGKWGQENLQYSMISACVALKPKEQMVAVGVEGEASILGSGEDLKEEVKDGKLSPKDRGPLQGVRAIDGVAWACGMGRQVYRREGPGKWICMDEGVRAAKGEGAVGFKDIDGFSSKDVYAVGFKGEIWHFNGKTWKAVQSPTNLVLNDVCCAGDGTVYIAGYKGILLRGDSKKMEVIDHDSTKENLWSLAWYGKKLYASTLKRVMTLEKGDALKMVDMDDPVTSAYHLSTTGELLLSVGPKDVMRFDGRAWERIE